MVNLQDTPSAGLISAADLDAARKHSTGRIHMVPAGCGQNRWPERRVNWPDTVPVQPAEACTELGADAVESMLSHRRTRSTVGLAVALAVAGFLTHIAWPYI